MNPAQSLRKSRSVDTTTSISEGDTGLPPEKGQPHENSASPLVGPVITDLKAVELELVEQVQADSVPDANHPIAVMTAPEIDMDLPQLYKTLKVLKF